MSNVRTVRFDREDHESSREMPSTKDVVSASEDELHHDPEAVQGKMSAVVVPGDHESSREMPSTKDVVSASEDGLHHPGAVQGKMSAVVVPGDHESSREMP